MKLYKGLNINVKMFNKEYIKWKYGDKSPLEKLIEKYPNFNWAKNLFTNPNISLDFVFQHPEQKIDINWNPHVTIDFIEKHPEINWKWGILSNNKNLNIDFIKRNIEKSWDWYDLSMNPCITWEDVQNNPELPWRWSAMSFNPNITWDIVSKNMDKHWHFGYLSEHKTVTLDIVQNNTNLDWSFNYLSRNPNITAEVVEQNLHLPWNWAVLSMRLPLEFLIKYKKEIPGGNDYLTIDIVKELHYEFWGRGWRDWSDITRNENITEEDIRNNPELPWDEDAIYDNPNMSYEFLSSKPLKETEVHRLCRNYFLYDEIVYKRSLEKDIKTRSEQVKNIFKQHPKIYRDILNVITTYVSYV